MNGERINLTFEFPERLWKRPIELYDGKPRFRVAASSYNQQAPYRMFGEEATPPDSRNDRRPRQRDDEAGQPDNGLRDEPQVEVSTEAGNTKVVVELASAKKEDLSLHCAEESLTLSIRTPGRSWIKEIRLPFRVDPDTAKAVFRNGKLELVVRRHGRFNPPRPRLDWV
ncbi:Hsp20/alpha crystallin family protein [[Eubacterium] cellulosolvens]